MVSTLWRNALIDARSWVGPSSVQYLTANASDSITPKCHCYSGSGVGGETPRPPGGFGLYRPGRLVYPLILTSSIGNEMAQNSGLMQGKRGVILGVANNRSIAWGIAQACRAAGAEIALTWQGDALKKRVEPLARELDGLLLGHCDVTDSATIDAVFHVLREKWGKIDFVVNAFAFSATAQLT